MRGKEVIYALVFTISGALLALASYVVLDDRVSAVVHYAILLIGIGAALVTVRIGRLGPFDGELGSPRVEMDLRARVARETDRAARYDRDFSMLAIRKAGGVEVWEPSVRGADDIVACRRGLLILLLPETSRGGALMLLRRVIGESSTPVQAALVSCPFDGRTGDELLQTLLGLVRDSAQPGKVVLRGSESVEALSIGGA